MTLNVCIRYYLNRDGSLREEPGVARCAEYWRLRDMALFADPETGGWHEMQIRMRLHEGNCPQCAEWFLACERISRKPIKIAKGNLPT